MSTEKGIKRRKNKGWMKSYYKKFVPNKTYFIDCAYHPCIVTRKTWYGWHWSDLDIMGKSLVNGGETSCSLYNCAPEIISKEEAMKLVEVWKQGERAVMIHMGNSPEDVDNFLREWRPISTKD